MRQIRIGRRLRSASTAIVTLRCRSIRETRTSSGEDASVPWLGNR
jgi:hypothetical protein